MGKDHQRVSGTLVTRHSRKTAAIVAFAVSLLLMLIVRELAFEAENSVDCYYHIAMADMGPSVYMGKEFPFLAMSSWTDSFSDKELVYHLLLTVLRSYQRLLGLPMGPPFNFTALFFTALLTASFVYTANFFKIRHLLPLTLLLVFVSPFFTNRILMLRPHVLSVSLMLLSCPLLSSLNRTRNMVGLFCFSAFTAWCYSNPHFILLPVVAFAAVNFTKAPWRALAMPLVCLAGIAFGYLFHPQFPNTFINWRIQCIEVVRQAINPSLGIALGTEFTSPGMGWIVRNSLPMAINVAAWLMLLNLKTRKDFDPCSNAVAVGIVAVVANLAVFFGIRAMEYAAPFSVLFAGMVLAEHARLKAPLPEFISGEKIKRYAWILMLVLSLAFLVFQTEMLRRRAVIEPLDDFARWAEGGEIPRNSLVANLIWSDFPMLLYSCPQFRYLSGMDPMFSYHVAPEKMRTIENLRLGKLSLSPNELADKLDADYAFVRKPYDLGKTLEKQGYNAIYSGRD
ncbi:MAG: hypothetical protein JW808_02775, partial [Victivallales bacterium]|nr:hypothetical protein [Victivallales bacterium]